MNIKGFSENIYEGEYHQDRIHELAEHVRELAKERERHILENLMTEYINYEDASGLPLAEYGQMGQALIRAILYIGEEINNDSHQI